MYPNETVFPVRLGLWLLYATLQNAREFMRWFPKIPKGMFWAVAVLAISSASALNNGLGRYKLY